MCAYVLYIVYYTYIILQYRNVMRKFGSYTPFSEYNTNDNNNNNNSKTRKKQQN